MKFLGFFTAMLTLIVAGCQGINDEEYTPVDPNEAAPWQLLAKTGVIYKAERNAIIPLFVMGKAPEALRKPENPQIDSSSAASQLYGILTTHYYDKLIELPSENSTDMINTWIAGKFPKIQVQQNINANELKGLESAFIRVFHFTQPWQSKFPYSYQMTFYTSPIQKVIVDAMEQINDFYYLDSHMMGAKIVQLPFNFTDLSMIVLLPHAKAGANELLENLDNEQLYRAKWMMSKTKLRVVMPKLQFSFKINFKPDLLQHLESNPLFSKQKTDFLFSGITLDEKGGENESNKSGTERLTQFIVDRPFIFIIEEESTGEIVSLGKVVNPVF